MTDVLYSNVSLMGHTHGRTHSYRTRLSDPPRLQPENPAGKPSHDDVARLAYEYWESRGRPEGSSCDDWYRAERELKALKKFFR